MSKTLPLFLIISNKRKSKKVLKPKAMEVIHQPGYRHADKALCLMTPWCFFFFSVFLFGWLEWDQWPNVCFLSHDKHLSVLIINWLIACLFPPYYETSWPWLMIDFHLLKQLSDCQGGGWVRTQLQHRLNATDDWFNPIRGGL